MHINPTIVEARGHGAFNLGTAIRGTLAALTSRDRASRTVDRPPEADARMRRDTRLIGHDLTRASIGWL